MANYASIISHNGHKMIIYVHFILNIGELNMTGIVETEHPSLTNLNATEAVEAASGARRQEAARPESRRYQARCIMGRGLACQRFVGLEDGIHARYGGVSLHGVI